MLLHFYFKPPNIFRTIYFIPCYHSRNGNYVFFYVYQLSSKLHFHPSSTNRRSKWNVVIFSTDFLTKHYRDIRRRNMEFLLLEFPPDVSNVVKCSEVQSEDATFQMRRFDYAMFRENLLFRFHFCEWRNERGKSRQVSTLKSRCRLFRCRTSDQNQPIILHWWLKIKNLELNAH